MVHFRAYPAIEEARPSKDNAMARQVILAAGISAAALIALTLATTGPVAAQAEKRVAKPADGIEHPASRTYRRSGPQVRGFTARRGGYSYSTADVINTYGDSRTRFGSTSVYRHPYLDRQTNAGPFDHGFFFDSGMAPRGGDSPYQN